MRSLLTLTLILTILCLAIAKKQPTIGDKDSFVLETYGGRFKGVPGISPSPKTGSDFRKILENLKIFCGNHKYCVEGKEWNCKQGDGCDCYNVEHIVDKQCVPLECRGCVEVIGNKIMAHGKWNQGIGHLLPSRSFAEKVRVYGSAIMNGAIESVNKCIKDLDNLSGCDKTRVYSCNSTNVDSKYDPTGTEDEEYEDVNATKYEENIFDTGIRVVHVGAHLRCPKNTCIEQSVGDCLCDECAFIEYLEEEKDLGDGDIIAITLSVFAFVACLAGAFILGAKLEKKGCLHMRADPVKLPSIS